MSVDPSWDERGSRTDRAVPELSVVLITPDRYETVRETVEHLRAQTARDRLEVVIVAPSMEGLDLDVSGLEDFLGYRVVEVGEIRSTGKALAAGIRHASAAVVAYAEEHSYPDAGWAEALIAAHLGPWAAVGSVVANANPATILSSAHLFMDFGPWVDPAQAGERDRLAGHHTAYKRAVLLEQGPRLESALEAEAILHRDIKDQGYRLYLEPAAKSHHVNISLPSSYIGAAYHGGRLFAATRARHDSWPIYRRLLYLAAMPVIAIVRLRRVLREVRRPGRSQGLVARILPALILGQIVHAAGEAMGYVFGPGHAALRRVTYELNRRRHLARHDRRKVN